jgi:hypothetical protein
VPFDPLQCGTPATSITVDELYERAAAGEIVS